MKTYGGVDVYIHVLLTAALEGNECSPSCTGYFTPGERAPVTLWIGRFGEVKILDPTGTRTPTIRSSSRYIDCATATLKKIIDVFNQN
jgi:hypothetical protein